MRRALLFSLDRRGELLIIHAELLAPHVRHGFTTRLGGVSSGPFASLNLSPRTADQPAKVLENQNRLAAALGMETTQMIAGEQVHGSLAHEVLSPPRTDEVVPGIQIVPGVDVLVTNLEEVVLTAFFADCVPVLLVDPTHKAIALAHAGWKGTLAGAAGVALEMLQRRYATDPAEVLAVLGPAIGPCCYEVGADLAARFRSIFDERVALGRRLDLRMCNKLQLMKGGVPGHRIHMAPWCTACHTDLFYSYRAAAGGVTGRFAAFLALQPTCASA
ncbi:MAG TPA: peptidoglycan editing factor PgeF [Firmicutes bacterium]|nr:peptidoglycan editing factor PgeF [Bacillota bacterium]